jgi:kynurenine formamidase
MPTRFVDLSHAIHDGLVTYPGIAAPRIGAELTREASRTRYEPGTEFHIGRIEMSANTGTYIDTPFHRFADGFDLAGLALEAVAELPGRVVDLPAGRRSLSAVDLPPENELAGRAVLVRTGWSRRFGTPAYAVDPPHLSAEAAERLVAARAALVGIDALNVDATSGKDRPVHTALLAAGIPIVEHLTGLDVLPARGFAFFAVPVKVRGLGSFPVRAFARLDADSEY